MGLVTYKYLYYLSSLSQESGFSREKASALPAYQRQCSTPLLPTRFRSASRTVPRRVKPHRKSRTPSSPRATRSLGTGLTDNRHRWPLCGFRFASKCALIIAASQCDHHVRRPVLTSNQGAEGRHELVRRKSDRCAGQLAFAALLCPLALALPCQTVRRTFLRRRYRRLFGARRSLLRRHCLQTPLAADLSPFSADLAHDLGEQGFRFLVHAYIVRRFRCYRPIVLAPKACLGYSGDGSSVRLFKGIERQDETGPHRTAIRHGP